MKNDYLLIYFSWHHINLSLPYIKGIDTEIYEPHGDIVVIKLYFTVSTS